MNHPWHALAVVVGEALAKRWLASAIKPIEGDYNDVDHKPDVIGEQPTRVKPGQDGLGNDARQES